MAQQNDCPNCDRRTFKTTPTGRKCTHCRYEMYIPPDHTGRGDQCNHCRKWQVFPHSGERWCRGCGAYYS